MIATPTFRHAFLLAALLLLPNLGSVARERPFVDEPEPDRSHLNFADEAWAEQTAELPPYPQEQDLVEFHVDDARSLFQYFIDQKNLRIGADEVVRYTLVIRSGNGASNVSHEGLRCNVRQYKIYAYGDGRETLQPVRQPVWQTVRLSGPYLYHNYLREHYFCAPERHTPLSEQEIIRRMQMAPQGARDNGFL